jgi:hypothetical protein
MLECPETPSTTASSPKLHKGDLLNPVVGVSSPTLRRSHSVGGNVERRGARAVKPMLTLIDDVPYTGKRRLSAVAKRIIMAQRFIRRASEVSAMSD